MVIDPHSNGLHNSSLHSKPKTSANTNTSTNQSKDTPESAKKPQQQDTSNAESVSISEAGKAIAAIEQQISASGEVDEAKVQRLRQALDNGSYSVNARNIADQLIQQSRLDTQNP